MNNEYKIKQLERELEAEKNKIFEKDKEEKQKEERITIEKNKYEYENRIKRKINKMHHLDEYFMSSDKNNINYIFKILVDVVYYIECHYIELYAYYHECNKSATLRDFPYAYEKTLYHPFSKHLNKVSSTTSNKIYSLCYRLANYICIILTIYIKRAKTIVENNGNIRDIYDVSERLKNIIGSAHYCYNQKNHELKYDSNFTYIINFYCMCLDISMFVNDFSICEFVDGEMKDMMIHFDDFMKIPMYDTEYAYINKQIDYDEAIRVIDDIKNNEENKTDNYVFLLFSSAL